MDSRDIAQ